MLMESLFRLKSNIILPVLICIAFSVFAVACGSAAEPQTIVQERIVEKEVVVEKIVEKEGEKVTVEVERIVVATPTPVPVPEGGFNTVDLFTIMVTSQGNEIWHHKYSSGENNLWMRLGQVWLVGAGLQDGSLVMDPNTGVATAWEIVDNGLAWEFTIREGMQFNDGSELDVEDVAFSSEWSISDEAIGVTTVRVAREVTDREVTGPDTFKITFADPMAYFGIAASEIDNTSMGTIISKDYWESMPDGANVENCTPVAWCLKAEAFQDNPGPGLAGAYNPITHLRSEEILYEKNENYFAADLRPYPFERISLRLVPEVSTRVAALRAGAADLIEADNTVVNQISEFGGRIQYVEEAVHIWINANGCNRETDNDGIPIMCSDLGIRQALDYAIDKTKIQALYGGPESFLIMGMHGIGSPSGLGYEEDLNPYPYKPDLARDLMADAGYPGGEGFNGGDVFPIHTWTGAGAPLTVEVSTLICQMWTQELGIDCEVNVGEEVSMKKMQYAGEIAGQYLVRTNENTFDGGRRMNGRYGKVDGYIGYEKNVSEAIKKANTLIGTQEERHEVYHDALKKIHDLHYDFSPGYLNQPYGIGARIASWDPWPLSPYPSALWTINILQ
jgi:ABC-type transport system substrate-binding protein